MSEHERTLRQNLYDIDLYARKSLDSLERGVDVIPDWVHHKIATARTHMKDAGHFVRYQDHKGRRYSGDKNGMCRGALENISEYAQLISKTLEKGKRPLPEWAANKLAIAAEYMDSVGHYLERRVEGRSYSGPAWQTQEFQKNYGGRRIYAETIEKVYETRGVAAVGGVRWVPPPAEPGQPYRGQRPDLTPSGRRRHVRPRGVDRGTGRRFGVPGHAPGTPGWAGAGGIAQAPTPGRRGGQEALPHAYGSLGYASMGDGSMDMATDGVRRYGLTWRYENTCPHCGGPSEAISERRFATSPDLKDPFKKKCITIIDPFTNASKEVCRKVSGTISSGLKDPFEMKRGPQLSAGSPGRRNKRSKRQARRKHRQARRYGEGEGDAVGRGPSELAPSGKMKRLWRRKQKSSGSFAGP